MKNTIDLEKETPMTVRDLIKQLQNLPENFEVFATDYGKGIWLSVAEPKQ